MILKILILILCSCSINTLNYMSRLNKRIFWEDLGIKSTRTIQSTYNGYINQKICLTCPIDRKMYYDIYNFSNLKAMTPGEYPNSIPFSWFIYGNVNNNNIQLCNNNTKLLSIYPLKMNKKSLETRYLEYTCEKDQICLYNIKEYYPKDYYCSFQTFKKNTLSVKLNFILDIKSLILDLNEKYKI